MSNNKVDYAKQLIDKIDNRAETVGIIGLGYVGLPLAADFAEAGIRVIGFDKSEDKILKISRGENYIADIDSEVLKTVVKNGKLIPTGDFSKIGQCDAIIICVPTPLDIFRKPDMSFIETACTDIAANMKRGTFISLESTTYPTTTEDFMLPLIEKKSGYRHGEDFWLAYSPERVDPGNKTYHTRNTPKVIGALNETGLSIGTKLYSEVIENLHPVSSPRVAEMVKILENTYRLVNISLINELALLAGKMEIDIWEVIEAAKTKPFGFQAFYPGPGIGGHCIPLDPFYLEHIAKKFRFDLRMINTAGHINMRMPHYMYIKIATALNREKKAVNGSKIMFLGVAYKPDINDDRESPALEIMNEVLKKGAVVCYNDPYIPAIKTSSGQTFHSVELTAENLKAADVVVTTTNHSVYDAQFIAENSSLIVDLRNMIKNAQGKVYKL